MKIEVVLSREGQWSCLTLWGDGGRCRLLPFGMVLRHLQATLQNWYWGLVRTYRGRFYPQESSWGYSLGMSMLAHQNYYRMASFLWLTLSFFSASCLMTSALGLRAKMCSAFRNVRSHCESVLLLTESQLSFDSNAFSSVWRRTFFRLFGNFKFPKIEDRIRMNTDEHGMFSSAVPFRVPFWPQAPGIFFSTWPCQCTRLCPGWGAVRRFDSDGNEEHLHSLGFQKCELRWNNNVLRLQRLHVLVNFIVFFFMVARSPLVALQSAKAGRIKERERTCFRKSTTADRRPSALSGSAIKRWATEL